MPNILDILPNSIPIMNQWAYTEQLSANSAETKCDRIRRREWKIKIKTKEKMILKN